MKKVIVESPYAGDVKKNKAYARMCIAHSLKLGEAPIASHLLYTQKGILDDNIAEERSRGLEAAFEWITKDVKHVFYMDLGMSKGMRQALDFSTKNGFHKNVEFRVLNYNETFDLKRMNGLKEYKQPKKVAVFTRTQYEFQYMALFPKDKFVRITGLNDLSGRLFCGVLLMPGWYGLGDEVRVAFDRFKEDYPKFFN